VNRIKSLINSYRNFIDIPWPEDAAAADRVIFCNYNQKDERRIRARIEEFAVNSVETGHDWALFDLSDTFAEWISTEKYSETYFKEPQLIDTISQLYSKFIEKEFKRFLNRQKTGKKSLVAIIGTASLFGFLKVKEVIEHMAPLVSGRLLVFFPGTCENNNYRLLDAYDGWNYRAMTITEDEEFSHRG
jgi:BREX protein BrxB